MKIKSLHISKEDIAKSKHGIKVTFANKNILQPNYIFGSVVDERKPGRIYYTMLNNPLQFSTLRKISKEVQKIGNGAFFAAMGMRQTYALYMSNVKVIGKFAFAYNLNNGLDTNRTLYLPYTLKYIMKYAFLFNTSLSYVIIPDSVEYIDEGAFNGCVNLKQIIFLGKTKDQIQQMDHYEEWCNTYDVVYVPGIVDGQQNPYLDVLEGYDENNIIKNPKYSLDYGVNTTGLSLEDIMIKDPEPAPSPSDQEQIEANKETMYEDFGVDDLEGYQNDENNLFDDMSHEAEDNSDETEEPPDPYSTPTPKEEPGLPPLILPPWRPLPPPQDDDPPSDPQEDEPTDDPIEIPPWTPPTDPTDILETQPPDLPFPINKVKDVIDTWESDPDYNQKPTGEDSPGGVPPHPYPNGDGTSTEYGQGKTNIGDVTIIVSTRTVRDDTNGDTSTFAIGVDVVSVFKAIGNLFD